MARITGFLLAGLVGLLSASPLSAASRIAFGLPAPGHSLRMPAVVKAGLADRRQPRVGPVLLVRRGPVSTFSDAARPRFAGGMVDLYPTAIGGLHFGVGTRYFSRPNFWVMAETATGGRLPDVRMQPRGGISQRRPFNRFTPAATVGYEVALAPGLVAGLEGGTLFGRAIPMAPRAGYVSDGRRDGRGRELDPIATASLRLAF